MFNGFYFFQDFFGFFRIIPKIGGLGYKFLFFDLVYLAINVKDTSSRLAAS
jgi:hypothetical protein